MRSLQILLGPLDSYVKTEIILHILNMPLRGSVPLLCVFKMITKIEIISLDTSIAVSFMCCGRFWVKSIYHGKRWFSSQWIFSVPLCMSCGRTKIFLKISFTFIFYLLPDMFQYNVNRNTQELSLKNLATTSHGHFILYPSKNLLFTMKE